MIPTKTAVTATTTQSGNKTYRLDKETKRIMGFINGQAAMEQAVEILLETERYAYEIYDWSFGSQLHELMGLGVWEAELKAASYIREALLVDDRVVEVKDMQVKGQNNQLSVSFSVVTKEGVLEQEWEVSEVGIKVL